MPNNNILQVRIKVDGDISLLNKLNETLKQTTKQNKAFAKTANKTAESIKQVKNETEDLKETLFDLAKAAVAIYAVKQAYDAVIDRGFRYLSFLEQAKIGIASLIATQLQGVESTKKWSIAMQLATQVLQDLKQANKETIATLPDLIEAFEASIAPAMKAGLTLQQLVTLTKLFAQAAGAMGVPLWNLKQEITSILMATIDYNSIIAKNLGITNEAIKQHMQLGDLYEYLTQKLQTFALASKDIQNSLEGLKSNIEDVWDELTAKIVKNSGIWFVLKQALKDVYETLQEFNKESEKTKAISDSLRIVLKGLLYGFEGLVTGLLGITEILGTAIIGLKSLKNEAQLAFALLEKKVIETKLKFLEFKKSLPFSNKEEIQKTITAYRQELNKLQDEISRLAQPLKQNKNELFSFVKGLDTIRKALHQNINNITATIDKKAKETAKQIVNINKQAEKSVADNYKELLKFLQIQHTQTTQLTAQQTQNLIEQIDKQYTAVILGQMKLLDLEEQKLIDSIKKAQLTEKQKEEYIYKIKQIYAKKRLELFKKTLQKQAEFEKNFYDEILNTAKNSADLEFYYKVKKLNEWATQRAYQINQIYAYDEAKRREYLNLLKTAYYTKLKELEKEYTGVIKQETKERVKYLDVFALDASQIMQSTAEEVTKMWEQNGWAMQKITSSLTSEAIKASITIKESFRQNVFKFISSNLKNLNQQTDDTSKGLIQKFFDIANTIDNEYTSMISKMQGVTKNFVSSVTNDLSNTLLDTFQGKIKTLGGFIKSFFKSLEQQFLRLVAKIAAEKIVLYFKNAWSNEGQKDGQGFVEKLLGIDVPFLKFAHGVIWGSGKYGIVPGSAKIAGDSFENDVVPALISPGEAVLPRSVVQQHRPLVEALVQKASISDVINSTLPVKRYAFGGFVGGVVHNIVSSVTHSVLDSAKGTLQTIKDFGIDISRTAIDLFKDPKNLFRDIGKTLKDLGINALHNAGRLIDDTMLKPLGLKPDDVLKAVVDALAFIDKYGWYIQLALAIMNPALIPVMLSADAMAIGLAFANGGGLKEGLKRARSAGALAGIGSEISYFFETGNIINSEVTITDSLKQVVSDIQTMSSEKLDKIKQYIQTLKNGDISQALGIDVAKNKITATLNLLKELKDNLDLSTILDKGEQLLQQGHTNISQTLKDAVNYILTHLKDIVSHITTTITSADIIGALHLQSIIQEYLNSAPLGLQGAQYQLAKGGIVTKNAIVEVAENDNPEAVIPLDKLEHYLKTGEVVKKLDTLIELNENMIYLLKQLHIDNVEGV